MLSAITLHIHNSLQRFRQIILAICIVSSFTIAQANGPDRLIDHFPEAASSGCMACHQEVEPIREIGSEMLNQIMAKGKAMGDPAGMWRCPKGAP